MSGRGDSLNLDPREEKPLFRQAWSESHETHDHEIHSTRFAASAFLNGHTIRSTAKTRVENRLLQMVKKDTGVADADLAAISRLREARRSCCVVRRNKFGSHQALK